MEINPTYKVISGDIAYEQEQAVCHLIQPAITKWMAGQGTVIDFGGLSAGLGSLPILALVEKPVPMKFRASRPVGERFSDICPVNRAVSGDKARCRRIGNSLKTQNLNEPIKEDGSITVLNCTLYPGTSDLVAKVIEE